MDWADLTAITSQTKRQVQTHKYPKQPTQYTCKIITPCTHINELRRFTFFGRLYGPQRIFHVYCKTCNTLYSLTITIRQNRETKRLYPSISWRDWVIIPVQPNTQELHRICPILAIDHKYTPQKQIELLECKQGGKL